MTGDVKQYIGTKIIDAFPVDGGHDPDHPQPGYAVRYEDGYESWSPAEAFEKAYQAIDAGLSFSHALEFIKAGFKVSRSGWNGPDQFVFLVDGSKFEVNREPLLSILGEGTEVTYRPHIDIRTADGSIGTWAPSMGDVMANDWYVLRDQTIGNGEEE